MIDFQSTCPKVLLLCEGAPGDSGVGEIFLRELCQGYPLDRLAFGVIGSPNERDCQLFSGTPSYFSRWTSFTASKGGGALISGLRRNISFRFKAFQERRQVYPELLQFAKEHNPDIVWGVLSSPTLFRLTPKIAKALNRPLVTTVWDPPEGIGHQYGLDRFSRRTASRDFFEALKASARCSVISERMHREYAPYCRSRIILRHGIAEGFARKNIAPETDEIRIGFCGTLYADDTWSYLLKALDSLSWHICGRPVRLVVAGRSLPFLQANRPARVEFLGWRPMDDVIDLMGSCHFVYLPYWFNPAYEDSVRLCFPTKLTTYLTAGRPTFYHGPAKAAVVDFFERFPVGYACHQTQSTIIADDLTKFCERILSGYPFAAAIAQAIGEELNLEIFRERFHELIGIGPPSETKVCTGPDSTVGESSLQT